jgi:YHS domain-containing protein
MRTRFQATYAVALVGAALLLGCSGGVTPGTPVSTEGVVGLTASAGEDLCELCLKPIVEAMAVVLETSTDGAEHRYRCIHCALVAARDRFAGDVQLRATSVVEGAPVEWDRRDGNWEVTPASALVMALPEVEDECLGKHVVLADRSEFEAYAGERKEAGAVRPFAATDTERILDAGKPAAPKEAKCPVSGQAVQVSDKTPWTVYAGETYYFCCGPCKPKFLGDPEGYLAGTAPKPQLTKAEGGCGGGAHERGSGGCGGSEAGKSGSCGGAGGSQEGGHGGCGGASAEATPGEGEAQRPETDEPGAVGD